MVANPSYGYISSDDYLQGQWVLYPYAGEDHIHLASIDFECAIADVYEDVTLQSPTLAG